MAKGYFVAHLNVHDSDTFAKYREKVSAIVGQYGGIYVVRGGMMEIAEGEELPPRTVILEFPSFSQVKAWYNSPEYQAILGLRLASATGSAQFVEGLE
ncbi:MAG: DUF1330 domain-containing protein [Hyphomicrobiaceae bacterium]